MNDQRKDDRLERNRILYNTLSNFFKRKYLLSFLFILSITLIIFFCYITTPVYEATSKILIRLNPQQQIILFNDIVKPSGHISGINPASNLLQILASYDMAREVVSRFSLDEMMRKRKEEPEEPRDIIKYHIRTAVKYPITLAQDWGLLEASEPNYFLDAVEDFIEDAQDIELEEETSVIKLTILECSPVLSSEITNFMSDRLIEISNSFDRTDASEAFSFAEEQVVSAEESLKQAEENLLKFHDEENIISLGEQKSTKLNDLNTLETKYTEICLQLSEAKAKLNHFKNEIESQKKLLKKSSLALTDPELEELTSNLHMLKIKIAGESETYTDSSKNLKSLKAQYDVNSKIIDEKVNMIVENDNAILSFLHPDLPKQYLQLASDVASLETQRLEVQQLISTIKEESIQLARKEIDLSRLERDLRTSDKIYTTISDKLSELHVQRLSSLSGYDLKIIDQANLSEDAEPSWPKWILIIPLGIIGSMIISIIAVFFIEYWSITFRVSYEIEEKVDIPVLCTIKKL